MAQLQQFWFLLFLLLPIIAFLYASVGHGGASSYLMMMTLFGFPTAEIRPTALILNIVVSGLAFMAFQKSAPLNKRLFLPLILFSVPAAWVGGMIEMDPIWFRRILGLLLLLPVLRFLHILPQKTTFLVKRQWWMVPLAGLGIGALSGLIGIGGGILLSPLLLLTGWVKIKETATLSALFIFFNSIAGLLGNMQQEFHVTPDLWLLLPLAIVGGLAGAWFGALRVQPKTLQYLLSTVLLFAAVKLLGL